MRRYYRSQTFRTDFLRFAREHPAGKHPLVQTWLEYEDAMRQGASSGNAATPRGIPLALGSELWWTDIPLRKQGSRMIELPCDIQGAVDALRHRSEFGSVGGRYYYVTREVTDGGESLDRISDWVASALRVCDGSRSMEQVVSQLAHEIPNIDIDVREYALMRLLEGLHADGLIEIFRPALDHSFSQQD
jgi:hypothetical protein